MPILKLKSFKSALFYNKNPPSIKTLHIILLDKLLNY